MKSFTILRVSMLGLILLLGACSAQSKTVLDGLTVPSVVSTVRKSVGKTLKLLSPAEIKKTIQSLRADVAQSKKPTTK